MPRRGHIITRMSYETKQVLATQPGREGVNILNGEFFVIGDRLHGGPLCLSDFHLFGFLAVPYLVIIANLVPMPDITLENKPNIDTLAPHIVT